jgi:predicted enzyme related to lactoylglutathione lyase
VTPQHPSPLVHLELHTGDQAGAGRFYASLSAWTTERVKTGGRSYLALSFGCELGGGIVECPAPRPMWLPYIEVDQIAGATDRARRLGASVLLEPREGPAGWRSVVSSAEGGEVALWQPKVR